MKNGLVCQVDSWLVVRLAGGQAGKQVGRMTDIFWWIETCLKTQNRSHFIILKCLDHIVHLCISVCLYVCLLSVCPPVHLPVCLPMFLLPAWILVTYLSVCLFGFYLPAPLYAFMLPAVPCACLPA
jgi:hypothetical protein